VLPQGKTEISSLLDHSGSGSHRREEHSLALVEIHLQWSHSLALELVLHSSIVTDLPWKKDCPESRICFKVDTVTRTERASPGKDRNFFIYRSHQRSGSLHRREEVHSAIVTDFAMKRLPDSHSAVSKFASVSKQKKSHERSLLRRERNRNSSDRSHQRSGSLHRREKHSRALVELIYTELSAHLGAGFSLPQL
jgi:hypothetical protein